MEVPNEILDYVDNTNNLYLEDEKMLCVPLDYIREYFSNQVERVVKTQKCEKKFENFRDMAKMTTDEVNVDLFDEVKRQRGVIIELEQKIKELEGSNRFDRVVIQKNTEIFKMQLHQTIDLQDKEGFAIYGYLPYKYITRVPGGWIYSNYDSEKDAYVPMDKIFVPFNNDMQ